VPPHQATSTAESCPFSIHHSSLSPLDRYEHLERGTRCRHTKAARGAADRSPSSSQRPNQGFPGSSNTHHTVCSAHTVVQDRHTALRAEVQQAPAEPTTAARQSHSPCETPSARAGQSTGRIPTGDPGPSTGMLCSTRSVLQQQPEVSLALGLPPRLTQLVYLPLSCPEARHSELI